MSISAPTPGIFFTLADLGLPVTQDEYLAQWVAAMQAAYPGYNPTGSPADRAFIQAQVFASWAASIAQLCSAGATELFRQFGVQMLGLPFEQGTPALAIVTVTATDTLGHTLPAGTQLLLTLNGTQVGFQTGASLTIPASSSSGTVTVAAVASGQAFNGAAGPAELDGVNWISGVTVLAAASGGVDQEDDDAYVQRLAQATQLLGYATATAPNLATRALNFIPTTGTDQQEVGRATAIDGYSPATSTFTVTTTNASPNVTVTTPPGTGITAAPGAAILGTDIPSSTFTANTANTSPTLSAVSSFTNLLVGDLISGAGIPSGTTIIALNPGTSQLTMSANATATASAVTVTDSTAIINSSTATAIVMSANATGSGTGIAALVAGTLGNERTVTLAITDASGNALNSDTITAVDAYLQTFREEGFIINVVSPAYSTVFLTVSVIGSPGFAAATVQSNVQAALLAYLNPSNFGLPQGAVSGWQNSQTIHLSRVLAVIQGTQGVDSVVPGTLAIGFTASPAVSTTDLVCPGAFPLPQSTTTSIATSGITVTTQ